MGIKQKIAQKMQDHDADDMVKIYGKWWSRWQEICGGDVDMDNVYVRLEMKLCRVDIQYRLMQHDNLTVEQRRDSVRNEFEDDEWELYLNGCDPLDENHPPYTDFENQTMKSKIKKAFKLRK